MPLREEDVDRVVLALARGEVIGLPTETVYGLAADGTNPQAVRRIFALKGRPADHPLILHLGDISWLPRYALDPPASAYSLGRAFWPGPLSMVLRRAPTVPDEVTGGLDTVAVRVPKHPVALRVLEKLGRPLAAPSANRFGEVSPTTREHVVHDFGEQVPLVLDGGACDVGVESTIVDLTRGRPRILRPGGVTRSDIEMALGIELEEDDGRGPAAPGTLEAHYAPRAELRLVAPQDLEKEVRVALDRGACVGVFSTLRPPINSERLVFRPMGDASQTAHDLYDSLRCLDAAGCELIFGTLVEEVGIGRAVADRLRRAAFGSKRSEND